MAFYNSVLNGSVVLCQLMEMILCCSVLSYCFYVSHLLGLESGWSTPWYLVCMLCFCGLSMLDRLSKYFWRLCWCKIRGGFLRSLLSWFDSGVDVAEPLLQNNCPLTSYPHSEVRVLAAKWSRSCCIQRWRSCKNNFLSELATYSTLIRRWNKVSKCSMMATKLGPGYALLVLFV